MTHGFEREGLEEYREAAAWYESQRDGLGEEFVVAVESSIRDIAQDPRRFPPLEAGLRVLHEALPLPPHLPLAGGTPAPHHLRRFAPPPEAGLLVGTIGWQSVSEIDYPTRLVDRLFAAFLFARFSLDTIILCQNLFRRKPHLIQIRNKLINVVINFTRRDHIWCKKHSTIVICYVLSQLDFDRVMFNRFDWRSVT